MKRRQINFYIIYKNAGLGDPVNIMVVMRHWDQESMNGCQNEWVVDADTEAIQ